MYYISEYILVCFLLGFPGGSVVKNLPAIAGDSGDRGSIPGSGRSPGEGNGTPLQYSCLEDKNGHGQRNLVGHSPWDRRELDMAEYVHMRAFFYALVSLCAHLLLA